MKASNWTSSNKVLENKNFTIDLPTSQVLLLWWLLEEASVVISSNGNMVTILSSSLLIAFFSIPVELPCFLFLNNFKINYNVGELLHEGVHAVTSY